MEAAHEKRKLGREIGRKIGRQPVAQRAQDRAEDMPGDLPVRTEARHDIVAPAIGDLERFVEDGKTRCAHDVSPC